MEQLPQALVPLIAAVACAGLSGLLLAGCGGSGGSEDEPAHGAVGDSTTRAAAQRTERLALVATPAPTPRAAPPGLPPLMVTFRGGLLTVNAHGAPLREILAAITRSVGVTFAVSGDAGEKLSVDLGPLPPGEVVARLLDRTSYGYALVDPARSAARSGPARAFLVKQGVSGDGTGQAGPAQTVLVLPAMSARATPVGPVSPPDEAALQRQRATDALFDACKSQGCDTS